jgi:hypothetical protein
VAVIIFCAARMSDQAGLRSHVLPASQPDRAIMGADASLPYSTRSTGCMAFASGTAGVANGRGVRLCPWSRMTGGGPCMR